MCSSTRHHSCIFCSALLRKCTAYWTQQSSATQLTAPLMNGNILQPNQLIHVFRGVTVSNVLEGTYEYAFRRAKAGMTHVCDPDAFATVKMIGREFCSLMSLQMQKLVSKETTLTAHVVVFICMSVWDNPLSRACQRALRKRFRACRLCSVLHWQPGSYLQTLLTVVDTLKGAFEERRPHGPGLRVADFAAHPVSY